MQVARRVVIQQSLSDQFMVAFKEQVDKNGVYNLPSGGPVSFSSTSLIVVLVSVLRH